MLSIQRISGLRASGSHITLTGLWTMSFHQPLEEYHRNTSTPTLRA